MASYFLLGDKYLPLESVRLGRLVTEKANPQDSYCDLSRDVEPTSYSKELNELSDDSDSRGGSGLRQKLLHLFSLGYSKRSSFNSRVYTKCVREYSLDNSKQYFENIIQLEEPREWIVKAQNEGSQVCLLVGFKTFLDAEITEYDTKFKKADLNLTVPTFGLVPEGALEVGVEGSVESHGNVKRKYTAYGEQVFALRYRIVKISQRNRKDLGTLGKSQWEYLGKGRQAHTTDTDNVLEAEISESEERDKFELDEDYDDEGWTKIEQEEGDFYL